MTVLELLIVVSIAIVMTAMAVPAVRSATRYFQLRAAVASVSGEIQTTRYEALKRGYPYRLVLDNTARTMQVQSDPTNTGAWANVDSAIPLAGSGDQVSLDTAVTLAFRPGGMVTSASADTNGNTAMTVTFQSKTGTITVSRYGNVNIVYGP
jgi:Tfp pilus assembly protein FimT